MGAGSGPQIGGCSSSQQPRPHGWAGDAPGAGCPPGQLAFGAAGMSPGCPVLLCGVMEEEHDARRKVGG